MLSYRIVNQQSKSSRNNPRLYSSYPSKTPYCSKYFSPSTIFSAHHTTPPTVAATTATTTTAAVVDLEYNLYTPWYYPSCFSTFPGNPQKTPPTRAFHLHSQQNRQQRALVEKSGTWDNHFTVANLATTVLSPFPLSGGIYLEKDRGNSSFEGSHRHSLSNIVTQLLNPHNSTSSGMELPSSRFSTHRPVHGDAYTSLNLRTKNMATLAMRPGPLPRSEERSLPSIHQLLPPSLFEARRYGQEECRTDSPRTSGPPILSLSTYAVSPSHKKRRRLSADEGRESRDFTTHRELFDPVRQTPGTYSKSRSLAISPISTRRLSTAESWQAPLSRSSPYVTPLPSIRTPHYDAPAGTEFRPELSRPVLPSINAIEQERRHSTQVPRQTTAALDYGIGLKHSFSGSSSPYAYSQSFSFAPSPRGHSISDSSSHHEVYRSPFANGPVTAYGSPFHEGYLADGFVEGKQRKRRGNLPKETTDKLRAWFMAHLHHPYPTEDEKQDLMRQTGLQMNQISNWFINARRRQLPTMINNARAESDARSAQVDLHGTLSEGERESDGSAYDDDGYGSPRPGTGKRPSV